jgi:hypothetical protein
VFCGICLQVLISVLSGAEIILHSELLRRGQ